jgi:hypothetical protein
MCPKFYGLIKDDNLNTIGILMENLNKISSNKLNLDLNKKKYKHVIACCREIGDIS